MLQIIGTKSCKGTQKAERFFSERRVAYQMIDLKKKPLAPRELAAIMVHATIDELLDRTSASYKKRGLQYMEFDAVEEISADQSLLVTPIVRTRSTVVVGVQESRWQAVVTADTTTDG